MKLKINIIFVQILIIFFATSASTVFSQIVGPHLTYEKADGTIVKIALNDLESIKIDSISCYDHIDIILKNDSVYSLSIKNFYRIYYCAKDSSIVVVNIQYGSDNYPHSVETPYDFGSIERIKIYKNYDHLYKDKRLTGATVSLNGLNYKIIHANSSYSTGSGGSSQTTYDTTNSNGPFGVSIKNPEDCYSASITDTSILIKYYSYIYSNYASGEDKSDYVLKIFLDTTRKLITFFDYYRAISSRSVYGSHIISSGNSRTLQIKDIPYKLTEDGFIEILDEDIPFENIVKLESNSGSGEGGGGGGSSSSYKISDITSETGTIRISCVFEWKPK
jgi:hypothetical protein